MARTSSRSRAPPGSIRNCRRPARTRTTWPSTASGSMAWAGRPNGRDSVSTLLDRAESVTGLQLDESTRSIAATAVHYGLGVIPGAMYGVLRRRVPVLAAGGGLLYGLLLFAGNDEIMNTEL